MRSLAVARGSALVAALLFSACLVQMAAAATAQEEAPKMRAAAGHFSINDLPADRDGSSLLTVPALGRYAIRAKSAAGARIQLIDMIAGPGESSGAAGIRDGRIDALLDKGVYKIRLSGAQGAAGKVKLTAEPFVEAEPRRPTLKQGETQKGELGDLTQRSYSIEVGPSGRVAIEAVGRSLQDLRLWRGAGELVDVAFEKSMVEPRPGRFMTRIRLEGAVPEGRYFVTAYGGEKLVWSDGATEQPFFVRLDPMTLLAAGVAEGVIGPFGSARFEAPAEYDSFRLELPQTTPARLEARRGSSASRASITKSNREPVATARLSSDGKEAARVEVAGFEGQKFQLRALRQESRHTFEASGAHLVSVDVAGEGGDEIPATALFARIENGKTRVLASDMPRIGPGHAWRGKFNLRGPTSLLFEATADGLVTIRSQGPKVRATIEPALGTLAPAADGRIPGQYDLQAGFYLLSLEPMDNAAGVIDVTIGQPGLSPPVAPAPPARTVIAFGEQKLEKDGYYLILANAAPSLLTGPRVVALPADIEKAPLPLWQSAGAEIVIPIRVPKEGKIVARDAQGADVPLTLTDEKLEDEARFATLRIAASDKPRALGLGWLPPPAKGRDERSAQEAEREHKIASVTPGRPHYFDLARDEKREFRFDLPQGGLYRIETLGRLQTKLAIGANLTPNIGEGEDNGPGHNALVTTYLRGGAYRAFVTALESEGHLGLSISPATLTTTSKLTSGASVRATLAGGKGAVIPIEIAEDGLYRLDLHGLQFDWRARLEDSEGWPLTKPGVLTRLTQRLEKGSYRLVVLPEDVEARMYARLRPVAAAPQLQGHGPHPLPFEKPQKLQWREPQAKDAPRAPDVWRFSLSGDADVELSISEGVAGDIIKNEKDIAGKVAGARKFSGRLGAGDYRVEARSLAHDDRLDYEISLTSKELQPGAPRFIDLPTALPFAIGASSIVDVTSFGDHEMIGALKDANGAVVERLQGRADDWNIALSRRLPAGAYTLELDEIHTKRQANNEAASEETNEGGVEGSPQEQQEQAADSEDVENESGVEIRFALLNEINGGALPLIDSKTVSGAGAHVLTLSPAPQGNLMLVAAQSTSEVALSIERRDANGWRVVGTERGLTPVAAWPATAGANAAQPSEWRVVVWSVGGGDAPISIAARAIDKRARSEGEIALEPAPIEGLASKVCVGLAAIPSASLVNVVAPAEGLLAGSAPERLLQSARSGPLAPQSERLWLLSRGDCKQSARVGSFVWSGGEIALDLAAGERAELPLSRAPSKQARFWLAHSAFAQPGLDAGRGMDAANGAALALAGDKPLRIWNASGADGISVALQAIDVAVAPPAQGGAAYAGVIAPKTAQPVTMSAGGAPRAFELAGGLAAVSSPEESQKLTIFGDGAPLSRTQLNAPAKIWLVNLTDKPLPARVGAAPGAHDALSFGRIVKRFYGASGQVSFPVEGEKGDRLVVVGAQAIFVGESGLVTQGASVPIDGRGVATIDYKPGLVAFWIERNGKSPWPAATPRVIDIPQRAALEGAAMSFSLKAASPMTLDVKSSAPAIVAFTQNGRRELQAFASGVEFHHYMSEGPATLEIFSPHDGALAGTLDIGGAPIIEAKEGLNDPVTLAAGASALFSFETKREGEIGIGLRSDPDLARLRLFDISGKLLGEGVAQSMKLPPGRYMVEARAPNDAPLSVVRLAVVGLSPPPAAPPAEVVADLLEKAGFKKNKTR